jgi:hypothetical protein
MATLTVKWPVKLQAINNAQQYTSFKVQVLKQPDVGIGNFELDVPLTQDSAVFYGVPVGEYKCLVGLWAPSIGSYAYIQQTMHTVTDAPVAPVPTSIDVE